MKKCHREKRSKWVRQLSAPRRILLAAVALVAIGTGSAAIPARAGLLDDWKSSLGSLWNHKSGKRVVARQARAKASSAQEQAGARRSRLMGVQKTLLQANEIYFNYWGQMRRTEAQIVRTRHRRLIVTSRYNRRRILFGRRLAAMQRAGKLSYLQIFFGSNTLSDLTRRLYLYNALVSRDATLQGELREDKNELDQLHSKLVVQWQDRNRLQRLANRERERLVGAEQEQRKALGRLLASRNDWLAFAAEQVRATREIDATINQMNVRRNAVIASYTQSEDEPSPRRYRSSRFRRPDDDENNAYSSRRDQDSQSDSRASGGHSRSRRWSRRSVGYGGTHYRRSGYRTYRRHYARVRVPYRVQRTYRVPSAGGVLKPMSISEIAFKDQLVPVPQSSGAVDAPARRQNRTSSQADDFPASDPAP